MIRGWHLIRVLRGRWRDTAEQGQISLFVVVVTIAVIAMIGLSVDGAGRMRAIQRADNIAAEAARAGGQAIDAGTAISGGAKTVEPAHARAAARSYLRQAGVDGDVAVSADHRRLTVTVHSSYSPVMLGIIGTGPMPVTGTASARLVVG